MESRSFAPFTGGREEEMNEAISDFSKSIQLNSHNANAYYFRGLALATRANWSITERTDNTSQALNDFKEALADYARTLALKPERTDIVEDARTRTTKLYEQARQRYEGNQARAQAGDPSRSPHDYASPKDAIFMAGDPVATFERGIARIKRGGVGPMGKDSEVKYDVKKTDSLVTPLVGIIRIISSATGRAAAISEYHFSYQRGRWTLDTYLFAFWDSSAPLDLHAFPVGKTEKETIEACFNAE